MRRLLVLLLALLAMALPLESAQDVLLKADHGAFTGNDVWLLGVGVPLKEGQAKEPGQIGIVSRTKGPLAVQCEARTRYPDGSIQWLWVDFLGPVEDSYRLVVSQQKQALSGVGVECVNAGGKVIVRNGALQVTWDTQYATPVKVEAAPAGGAMRAVAEGRGDGRSRLQRRNGLREGREGAFLQPARTRRRLLRGALCRPPVTPTRRRGRWPELPWPS